MSQNTYPPIGVSSGDRNQSDASGFLRSLIDQIASHPTLEATELLTQLLAYPEMASYCDHLRHASATQRARRRDAEYVQPIREANRSRLVPMFGNIADLQALLVDHLRDIKRQISSSNTDIYKQFWNEDRYGRIITPKPEESCRDVLVEMLRQRLRPLRIIVEPEGHMVANKRADISVALPGQKILVELKRDYHPEVGPPTENQFERFYAWDQEASGFAVYGVFWFGEKRGSSIPAPPNGLSRPVKAEEMEDVLSDQAVPCSGALASSTTWTLTAGVFGRNDLQSEHKSSTKSFELIEAEVSHLEASPETPRRRWSAAAKERIVAAAAEPGANVSAIARSNGLSPQQVFAWRRKAAGKIQEPRNRARRSRPSPWLRSMP